MSHGNPPPYDDRLATLPGVQRLSSTLAMKSVVEKPIPPTQRQARAEQASLDRRLHKSRSLANPLFQRVTRDPLAGGRAGEN